MRAAMMIQAVPVRAQQHAVGAKAPSLPPPPRPPSPAQSRGGAAFMHACRPFHVANRTRLACKPLIRVQVQLPGFGSARRHPRAAWTDLRSALSPRPRPPWAAVPLQWQLRQPPLLQRAGLQAGSAPACCWWTPRGGAWAPVGPWGQLRHGVVAVGVRTRWSRRELACNTAARSGTLKDRKGIRCRQRRPLQPVVCAADPARVGWTSGPGSPGPWERRRPWPRNACCKRSRWLPARGRRRTALRPPRWGYTRRRRTLSRDVVTFKAPAGRFRTRPRLSALAQPARPQPGTQRSFLVTGRPVHNPGCLQQPASQSPSG